MQTHCKHHRSIRALRGNPMRSRPRLALVRTSDNVTLVGEHGHRAVERPAHYDYLRNHISCAQRFHTSNNPKEAPEATPAEVALARAAAAVSKSVASLVRLREGALCRKRGVLFVTSLRPARFPPSVLGSSSGSSGPWSFKVATSQAAGKPGTWPKCCVGTRGGEQVQSMLASAKHIFAAVQRLIKLRSIENNTSNSESITNAAFFSAIFHPRQLMRRACSRSHWHSPATAARRQARRRSRS